MAAKPHFSSEQAREVGKRIGIDWETAPFDVEQFRAGMEIALAHLNEFPDYYTRLEQMEAEAEGR